MEEPQERFQVFIDTLNPYPFLETGNEGMESLTKFLSFKLHLITPQHISVLIKIIFLENSDTNTAFPFFAGFLLESLTGYLGDKFVDFELLKETFALIEKTHLNLTICGYFSQFLKPLLIKKNKIIEKVLKDNQMCQILLNSVQSSAVCLLIKEYIEGFPESCTCIINSLIETVHSGNMLLSGPCCEILLKVLKQLNPKTTSAVFNESTLLSLLNSQAPQNRNCFKLITEILLLPKSNQTRNVTLRIISDHISHLANLSISMSTEAFLEILKIFKLSIDSDFGNITYQVGSSQFIKIATEKFFDSIWNSQLHLRYFELVKSSMNSGSNSLISSILYSGLLNKLIEQSENSNVTWGKISVRKGFMGFVTKIGCVLRDSKIEGVKNLLRTTYGWEGFLIYITTQESIESSVLGGRLRYRHMTADEISEYTMLDKNENMENVELYFSKNFWSIPVDELDDSL